MSTIVGWNTRLDNGRWVPTFPNARYLIRGANGITGRRRAPPPLSRTGDYITDSVLPVFAAGQAELVADEHAVAPEISVGARARPHAWADDGARRAGREQAMLWLT
jgi:hypothetical protein